MPGYQRLGPPLLLKPSPVSTRVWTGSRSRQPPNPSGGLKPSGTRSVGLTATCWWTQLMSQPAGAVLVKVASSGAFRQVVTTRLLTVEEMLQALAKAGHMLFRPPGGEGTS